MRNELLKLCLRRRTWLGFLIMLAVEVASSVVIQAEGARRNIVATTQYPFYAADSGLTVAFLTAQWAGSVLAPLFVAFLAGDIVAKEVEDGTMRALLCRPVSRRSVLWWKYAACAIYSMALALFVNGVALGLGLMERGAGGSLRAADEHGLIGQFAFGEGLLRYAMAAPVLGLSLAAIAALAFMFSCMEMRPATAAVLALSVTLADSILHNLPIFESLRGWFLSERMAGTRFYEAAIPWRAIMGNAAWRATLAALWLAAGAAVFERRDLKAA